MKAHWVVAVLIATALPCAPGRARAEGTVRATFALIIGSNISVDRDVRPLKYADDDAANYLDLFRVLGARTYLLSRLDDNTRRLHPQAAAEAAEPNRAALERATAQIATDVAQAQARQVETVLYVVYAGHGNVYDGQGYITLEDMRISGSDLAHLVARIPATNVHIIVDACASYYLAYTRGPGGERRPLSGFQDATLIGDPRVGLLLSTSSARESHEWDGFQAGVFSEEVRSGLYGAADANGDGQVSYREIAAFVNRANAAIPNDRFRPNIYARAPRETDMLIDLRHGLERRLEIDGVHAGHYSVEDARGVRLLDLHNSAGQAVNIVRPSPSGPLYVHRTEDGVEFTLPATPQILTLGDLQTNEARVATRGADQEAFRLLFSLPFDRSVVDAYVEPGVEDAPPFPSAEQRPKAGRILRPAWRSVVGWSSLGLGGAALSAGAILSVAAGMEASGAPARPSQAEAAQRNSHISAFETGATAGYVFGGVAVAAGAALLFWPDARLLHAVVTPLGGYVGYETAF